MLYDLLKDLGLSYNITALAESLIVAAVVFCLTLVSTRLILPVLQAKKLNQPINMYVTEHSGKSGTPTMGGICFLISSLLTFVIWMILEKCGEWGGMTAKSMLPAALTVCLGAANSLIGFIDDYKKLIKKDNEGLNEKQKMALQIVAAGAYICSMGITDNLITSFHIPFTNYYFELGWFAYLFYLIVIVGFVNSTNITDGIDGLASSQGACVALGLVIMSAMRGERYDAVSAGLLLGALLGFLVFNRYPAKVFMGDTGSLFIGGIIMGIAINTGELLAVIIMSLVFICEMMTSLLQRLYFKLSHGKRLFKKAPIHHTFQLEGWSENKIVMVFLLVSAIFTAIGVLGVMV